LILEIAMLLVRPGHEPAFEEAFAEAESIIASMPGYIEHELQRCIEVPNKYALLVRWTTLAAHTEGFRSSAEYQQWRDLLHHFYDPLPTVEHFTAVG
jgi:heme-degrading monooxygenase HmoA